LAPGLDEPRITDWTTRARLLGELGVEIVVIERFTRAFAQHPPEWFVDEVLGRRLCPLELVVGYDFRFGRARAGNVDTLRARLHGTKVLQVEALEMEGEVVSSSRIRRLLREGEVETAARLLGRPHEVSGVVVPGDRRGRTLGFPTANVETDAGLLPPSGVYAVRVQVDGGPATDGVANLGQRPTFGGAGPFLVEAHLLDFRGDLYGRALRVHFVKRLRSEQRFADVAALQEQIRADVVAARAVLAQ
jgi:riboflavin kinase/FMN adenylyltransferase